MTVQGRSQYYVASYNITFITKSNGLTHFDVFAKPKIPQVSIKTLQKDHNHNIKVHHTSIDLNS